MPFLLRIILLLIMILSGLMVYAADYKLTGIGMMVIGVVFIVIEIFKEMGKQYDDDFPTTLIKRKKTKIK